MQSQLHNTDSNKIQLIVIMALQRCLSGLYSKVTVVLGAQWGDQGKGKVAAFLSGRYDIAVRFNGGANAGHSVQREGHRYNFHLVPSGIISPNTKNLLSNGVVVRLDSLFDELGQLDKNKICYADRMFVSDRAHLVTNYQVKQDIANEERSGLGSAKKGIGPTEAAKTHRYGLRIGDLAHWQTFGAKYRKMASFYHSNESSYTKPKQLIEMQIHSQLQHIKQYRDLLVNNNMIVESVGWLNKNIKEGKRVLLEGASASMLDLDLGSYPYVSSIHSTIGEACIGAGISPNKIETVLGVVKAYTTRIGAGSFPTEQSNHSGEFMRKKGHEFGTTTKRPRRCGWLDLPVVRYTNMLNGYSSVVLSKLDVLSDFDQIKVAVAYKLHGKQLDSIPGSLEDFEKVEVVYETLKGWKKDLTGMKNPEELPKECIDYIRFVEKHTGVPVSWVGNGPQNDAMIRLL